jgi:hypothetical protein
MGPQTIHESQSVANLSSSLEIRVEAQGLYLLRRDFQYFQQWNFKRTFELFVELIPQVLTNI